MMLLLKVDSEGGIRKVDEERVFLIVCIPICLTRIKSCTSTVAVGGALIRPEAFTSLTFGNLQCWDGM